jgi:hypothetical protein
MALRINRGKDRVVALEAALHAVLLFHGGGYWGPNEAAQWERLTGAKEATTKALCDVVRAALFAEPEPEPDDLPF